MALPDSITVVARYNALVDSGRVEKDPAQKALAAALDRVLDGVRSHRVARKSSALGWLFASRREEPRTIEGLYIHGPVGRGKTMLMDIFFKLVPAKRKRRTHFNTFMNDAHERIHAYRQKVKAGEVKDSDPIPPVADDLMAEGWVLCFDEFAVSDITDAMLLSRLFSELFSRGCVLVATSNVAPRDLYRDGLNRDLFLPFIDLLENHARVFNLQARTDYRLEKTANLPVYHAPLDEEARSAMDSAWQQVTAGKTVRGEELTVKGHAVPVPQAAGTSARFSFEELCARPLGPADYAAIAERFSTVFLDGVPKLAERQRNEAKRFIALVDTFYDRHVRLFVSAEAEPDGLMETEGTTEAFEFERAASRLIEMRSRDYLDGRRSTI
ncbi:cell division protein ZapE [Pararhizobium mangrovi]|uniref:AFG1 family ATPase n=1 Tax=Pararhizobium mangrovi TaxID=2590452 RepID=A0A506U4K9_9HYPH|nr:cell division protein ZapE [Pararhizobium mangrovi]TPW27984.1 AFG1 family ATPase [Pararhizobium mangrovi]